MAALFRLFASIKEDQGSPRNIMRLVALRPRFGRYNQRRGLGPGVGGETIEEATKLA